MATIDSMGLQAVVPGNNPQISASNLLSNPSAAAGVARSESQGMREKVATPPEPSARVNISENGRARLQAEGANAVATALEMVEATNAQQTMRAAPVAATGAAPDVRNDAMLTAAAPSALATGAASTQGMSAEPAITTAIPASADPASPVAALAPVASDAPSLLASSGNMTEAAAPANPGTPRAESGRQQAEALATGTEAMQNDNRANRQDMSPVLTQGGVTAYRDIFSG